MGSDSFSRQNAHILVVTDRRDRCFELVAIVSQVCPAHVLSPDADTFGMTDATLCAVIDIDFASEMAEEKIERLRAITHGRLLPLVFVIDTEAQNSDLSRNMDVAKAFAATNYLTRPFEGDAILRIIAAAFGRLFEQDAVQLHGVTGIGVAAAHKALSTIFEVSRAKRPLVFDEVKQRDDLILDALHSSGIRSWLEAVRRHHSRTYRHSLLVTGFAVAFAQKLGMREEDQKRLARAGLLHDIGKAFTPLSILDKPDKLTDEEMKEIKKHPVLGHEVLIQQGGFPDEILDCVLHHHELLDGSGYPDGLRGDQIVDLVRITTIADIFSALIEERSYKQPLSPDRALEIMQQMGGKLDGDLLRAFSSVALDIG